MGAEIASVLPWLVAERTNGLADQWKTHFDKVPML